MGIQNITYNQQCQTLYGIVINTKFLSHILENKFLHYELYIDILYIGISDFVFIQLLHNAYIIEDLLQKKTLRCA